MHRLVNLPSRLSYLIIDFFCALALLPSSFAMYTTTLACAYAFETCSSGNYRRTLASTLLFAVGGIVGWPFALALAIPFVFEELFVSGGDIVMPHARIAWMVGRFRRLILASLTSALTLARFLFHFQKHLLISLYRFQSSASIVLHTAILFLSRGTS